MNVAQLKEAIAVANETGLIFMEASWNRWHPRTLRLKEIVDSGVIGEVKTIRTAFTYDGLDPSNIRAIYELGGGGLYDLGPYSVAAPIWLMDFAPVSNIKTDVKWHPGGCDETVTTSFDIGGAHAEALTSMNTPNTLYLMWLAQRVEFPWLEMMPLTRITNQAHSNLRLTAKSPLKTLPLAILIN
jgi:predicted dehydrogenase